MGSDMLVVKGLTCSYGISRVLFGVDLHIGEGEFVALVGRNGMGKSTTIHSIFGIVQADGGSIEFCKHDIRRLSPSKIARLGLGLVPEGRRIFPNLTTRENLIATAANYSGTDDPWTYDRVLDLFPSLKTRVNNYGNQLSGGEQQMLAIGRALMLNPRLLVLDEATEGLAPLIRDQIWRCLARLKAGGQAVLIVDKNIDELGDIADRFYILQNGQVSWTGTAAQFVKDTKLQDMYLSVTGAESAA
jgi:branched-chain amino acid transport system ATP-binding protein